MDEDLKSKFADYLEYFEDIRKRILGVLIVFIIFFVVGFLSSGKILSFLISWFHLENATIVSTSPFQFLDLSMSVGIFLGFFFCTPFIIYHIYNFLKEGLVKREKIYFLLLLPIAFILFFVGFAYSFGVLYYCLNTIASVNQSLGINNLWDIGKFIYEICLTSVLLGLLFQFPVILSFLVQINLLDVNFLKQKRKVALAIIFVVVSFLPPTDGISLLVMALPMILIYELTIIINNILLKKKSYSLENIVTV